MHIQRMPEEKTLSTGDITNGGKYWGLALEGELAKGLKATAGYTQFKDMGTGFAESLGADALPDDPVAGDPGDGIFF